MSKGCVIVTGAAGGIGRALVHRFARDDNEVIAVDSKSERPDIPCEHYVACDLGRTVDDLDFASATFAELRHVLADRPLIALINNAAVQILGPTERLDRAGWRTTLDVNLLAPFFWAQAFLAELEASGGCILNISSIHARLTKPGFVAYATSKGALSTLTRAMAVDLGERVRVNGIEPAAISTEMLLAGFADAPDQLRQLESFHPRNRLGDPDEVARLAVAIVGRDIGFLHGSVISLDGGIGGRLHDPA